MTTPSLPTTHQAASAIVDEARRRQDALVAEVRTLAADSRALENRLKALTRGDAATDDTAGTPPGLLASLGRRLRRRRQERPAADRSAGSHGESALRARVEAALQETRRASWLADRFGALRQELDDELARLHSVSGRAALELERLQGIVIASRVVGDDESAADVDRDEGRRQRASAERQTQILAQLDERIAVLVVSARGVIDIVDALHDDVAAFARAAASQTEGLSARARAVGVAEDARAVLTELETALSSLGGTLDEAAIFAAAVSERIASTPSSDPAFQQSLETLVQGALARRAVTAAVEKAHVVGGSTTMANATMANATTANATTPKTTTVAPRTKQQAKAHKTGPS